MTADPDATARPDAGDPPPSRRRLLRAALAAAALPLLPGLLPGGAGRFARETAAAADGRPPPVPVANAAEFQAALDRMTDPAADWTILLQEGAVIGTGEERIRIAGRRFAGRLVDPNAGAANATYDFGARAALRGGSLTIASGRPLGARIAGRLEILGSGPVAIEGVDFTAAAATEGRNRDDGGPETATRPNATAIQLLVGRTPREPELPVLLVRGCRFGGSAGGMPPNRWPIGLAIRQAAEAVIEDNLFDGFYAGVTGASIGRFVVRRNEFRRQLVDAIRCFGNRRGEMTAERVRFECLANTVLVPHPDADWAGAHADGIQVGTKSDEVSYDLFISRNHLGLALPLVAAGRDYRTAQGIWLDDSPEGVFQDGEVSRNFIEVNAATGLGTWRCRRLLVRNNTLVRATLDPPPPQARRGPRLAVNAPGEVTLEGNIAGTFARNRRSQTTVHAGRNLTVDPRRPPGDPAAYPSVFAGPFRPDPAVGVRYELDRSSAAAFRADADRVFAPRPGGPATGIGHLA
jgi:hypothetical protein